MALTRRVLVIRYIAFAILATAANLATQNAIFLAGHGAAIFIVAILAGTAIGLIVKYVLDKYWIFYDAGEGLDDHGRKFALYTAMGIVTTAIFWGTETLFWVLTHSPAMRNLGAVLGLAIGYVMKFHLDRRFVFTDARLAPARSA